MQGYDVVVCVCGVYSGSAVGCAVTQGYDVVACVCGVYSSSG